MTVKELIAHLAQCPQEARVILDPHEDEGWNECVRVTFLNAESIDPSLNAVCLSSYEGDEKQGDGKQ
jgi:hypothetical protein